MHGPRLDREWVWIAVAAAVAGTCASREGHDDFGGDSGMWPAELGLRAATRGVEVSVFAPRGAPEERALAPDRLVHEEVLFLGHVDDTGLDPVSPDLDIVACTTEVQK